MRFSALVLTSLAATALLLSTGCASLRPAEDLALCEAAKKFFSNQKMDLEPLFQKDGTACEALSAKKLSVDGARELFSDSRCSQPVSFGGEPWERFCNDNLLGNDRTKNHLGNPDAWTALDPSASERIETLWALSQDTTLHLAVINQTENRRRPYLKRVEYRRENGCALGMHVYKSDPNAESLKAAMFIHGGGWKYRGISAVAGIGTAVPNLTDRGYVVFAPFYRLLGTADGPTACQNAAGKDILADIDAALQWVLDNGESFGVAWGTEKKVSLMGQSAGGHLAAYLATYHPETIERGILMYPAPDLGFFTAGIKPGGLYDGEFEKSQELLLAFFPQDGVTNAVDLDLDDPEIRRNSFPDVIQPDPSPYPPLDMVHGDVDTTVPVELTTRLCAALDPAETPSPDAYSGGNLSTACGPESRLTIVGGANHALDLRCASGRKANTLAKLKKDGTSLCPAGSQAGAERVRKALLAAYAKF